MQSNTALQVHDIYLPLNHLFTRAAKQALKNQVKDLNPKRRLNPPVDLTLEIEDTVRFFGSTTEGGERGIFDAAKKVANQINFYAERGLVTGALSKLLCIQLATQPHELDKYMVVSYVAFSPQGVKLLTETPDSLQVTPIEFISDVETC